MDITTASPVEIDTRIAELHGEIVVANELIERLTNRVLDHAGLREYVPATWTTRKSGYRVTGTFEQGVELLREHERAEEAWRAADYAPELRPARLSNYAGSLNIDATVAERDAAIANLGRLWNESNRLNGEWVARGRWSRFYLVVSSAGHIHSSTRCQSCRLTTQFGWMPNMSGLTEAEAMESLGAHAEALCSVCFPSAPVAGQAKVTKAKAAKMSAGTVADGHAG